MPQRKTLVKLGVVAVVGFVGLQFVPVQRFGIHTEDVGANPPERFDIGAPPEVAAIMRRACFDCHTNETEWPLYTRFAPSSWLMAYDIHNGRSHLNLSKWGDADEDERQTDKENCWDQIEAGDMPPKKYIYPFHLKAKLSDADKAALKAWLLKDKKDDSKKDDSKKDDSKKDDSKKDDAKKE